MIPAQFFMANSAMIVVSGQTLLKKMILNELAGHFLCIFLPYRYKIDGAIHFPLIGPLKGPLKGAACPKRLSRAPYGPPTCHTFRSVLIQNIRLAKEITEAFSCIGSCFVCNW